MLTLEFEEHRTNEQGKEQFEEYDWWKELVRKATEKQTLSSFVAGRMKKRELPSEKIWYEAGKQHQRTGIYRNSN